MAQRISPAEEARFMLRGKVKHGASRHRVEQQPDGTTRRVVVDRFAVHSVGYERGIRSSLRQLAKWSAQFKREGRLHRLSAERRAEWLALRAKTVGETQLRTDRRALEIAYREHIRPLKSEVMHEKKSRAYSPEQIARVMAHQSAKHAIATEAVWRTGVRAHELLTLRPATEQERSAHREWRGDRFSNREPGQLFTVAGKGGLVREVMVPNDLAERLEALRLAEPRQVRDREIKYVQHYDIGAGNNWSKSFSDASKRALGWSNGGHGLRHTYTQDRVNEEQAAGLSYDDALAKISQELGHFRPDITLEYLR